MIDMLSLITKVVLIIELGSYVEVCLC